MTTRRDVIKAGAGLAAILASGKAPAGIVKSMLGARGALLAAQKGWTNPYVTDGLVAQWDGEWNAGGGVHDPNAMVWKNLVNGGLDLLVGSYGNWSDNSLVCLGGRIPAYADEFGALLPYNTTKTVTIVAKTDSNGIIYTEGSGNYNGSVLVTKSGDYLTLTRVASASAGLSNRVHNTVQLFSLTFIVSNSNVVYAAVNGDSKLLSYSFSGKYSNRVTIGDRYNDTSNPFTGEVFAISEYSRALTAEEIAANYAVDKARFGLP